MGGARWRSALVTTEVLRQDLSRLATGEAAVYDDLRFDRLQPRVRLEQERVGFAG